MLDETQISLINGDVNLDLKGAPEALERLSYRLLDRFLPGRYPKWIQAKCEGRIIEAATELYIKELCQRSENRVAAEEMRRQENMEQIVLKVAGLLGDSMPEQTPDEDWLANFWDKSRLVSNEDMQTLWAKILAGEATNPGEFSRKTVNLVADLNKSDAELFTKICGLCFQLGNRIYTPLVLDVLDDFYKNIGINMTSLDHLDSLGLIKFDRVAHTNVRLLNQFDDVFYFEKKARFEKTTEHSSLDLGLVGFTHAGHELAFISTSEPIDGFWEYVLNKWPSRSSIRFVTE